jgi:colanic acid/amylovoran biosynthesis glycosyltransferase
VLLFCGRFVEKKGLPYALEALRLTLPVCPRLHLRIVGDGELRPEIEGIIDKFHLKGHVTLLGFRSHQETIEELTRAHLLIQPSVTALDGDSEGGAPTILLEAQACGLPVLATRHADIPSVVDEDVSALLAPERDAESLAAHLLTLARRPERWPAMGRAGRERVERYHSAETLVVELERRYHELVGG